MVRIQVLFIQNPATLAVRRRPLMKAKKTQSNIKIQPLPSSNIPNSVVHVSMSDKHQPSSSSSSSSSDQNEEENPNQTLIPNLPNDVALQCIARIPRSYYPHLSLISKQWRTTLRSAHLHDIRRQLYATESLLFINLRIFNPQDSTFSFKWYFLDPSRNSQNTPDPPHLSPIYPCPSHAIGASYVNLGQFIYVIGGSVHDFASNKMWVYDCLMNRWELGPKMRVEREFAASGVVNGKIYVLGGCLGDNWARSMNWAEVFDPETRVWGPVRSPVEVREKWMHGSAVVGGRVYGMADRGGVVFEPGTGEWGAVSMELDLGWRGRAAVVDGVLYCYDYLGKVRGFDVGENVWKELRGVNDSKGCLPKFLCGATMANVGGRLFVVWEGKSGCRNGKEIDVWCAEIAVRKDESGELWGSVLWSNVIIVIPKGSSIVHCLGVQL